MTAITYRLDHIANSQEKAPLYYCPPRPVHTHAGPGHVGPERRGLRLSPPV